MTAGLPPLPLAPASQQKGISGSSGSAGKSTTQSDGGDFQSLLASVGDPPNGGSRGDTAKIVDITKPLDDPNMPSPGPIQDANTHSPTMVDPKTTIDASNTSPLIGHAFKDRVTMSGKLQPQNSAASDGKKGAQAPGLSTTSSSEADFAAIVSVLGGFVTPQQVSSPAAPKAGNLNEISASTDAATSSPQKSAATTLVAATPPKSASLDPKPMTPTLPTASSIADLGNDVASITRTVQLSGSGKGIATSQSPAAASLGGPEEPKPEVIPNVTFTSIETHLPAVITQFATSMSTPGNNSSPPNVAVTAAMTAAPEAPPQQPIAAAKILVFELQPESMGTMTVKMRITRTNVDVQITTDRHTTLSMLDNSRDKIVDALQAVGSTVDSFRIQASSPQAASDNPQGQSANQDRNAGAWTNGDGANSRRNDSNREHRDDGRANAPQSPASSQTSGNRVSPADSATGLYL